MNREMNREKKKKKNPVNEEKSIFIILQNYFLQ